MPEMPVGYGLLAEAGDRLMAQVSPVRTWQHRVGRILKPSAAWIRSRGAHLFLVSGLLDPAAQQFANLCNLSADMDILSIVEPVPLIGDQHRSVR
jgi:hypothetical protein